MTSTPTFIDTILSPKFRESKRAYRKERIFELAIRSNAAHRQALQKFGIEEFDRGAIVKKLKLLLKADAWARKNNPLYNKIPLYRWSLLACWISERRAHRAMRKVAERFQPRMAAE